MQLNNYLSLVKFSHTVFAMPFALIGFFLAVKETGSFEWLTFLYVILCMVFARNAAMGFNRYLDRDIDKKNPRTKIREIPAGKITPKNALIFVVANSVAFIATTYFINTLVLYLSPIALLVILGYSYTKRFTALCHFILGIGLSLAPIGAYLSVTAQFSVLPVLFSFMVLFWVSGFDIIYALQDEEFDKNNLLHSVPSLLGKNKALRVAQFLHTLTAAIAVYIAYSYPLGTLFYLAAGVFISLLIYQHSIVKPNDLSRVNLAFFTTNGIASVVFAAFTITGFFVSF